MDRVQETKDLLNSFIPIMVVPISKPYALENYRRELNSEVCYWNSLENKNSADKEYEYIAFIMKGAGERTTYVHKILNKSEVKAEDHPRREHWKGFINKKYLIEFEE